MEQWENIYQHMEEIYEDLQEVGYQKKYKTRFERLMGKCTAGNDYAAVKATNMLNDDIYIKYQADSGIRRRMDI